MVFALRFAKILQRWHPPGVRSLLALQQRKQRMGLHRIMAKAGTSGLLLAALGLFTPVQAQTAIKFSL